MAALVSVVDNSPRLAIVWLLVAQLIDGIDGPIARKWMSGAKVPRFDGYILDLVIDYVTCVLVPAFFMYQFKIVPHNAIGMASLSLMLGSSAMWFSRTQLETEDHWFLGFPCAWNMVIPTLYLVSSRVDVNVVIVCAFALLSITDIQFPHVMKAKFLRPFNIAFMVLWVIFMLINTYLSPDAVLAMRLTMLIGPAWFTAAVYAKSLQGNNRAD